MDCYLHILTRRSQLPNKMRLGVAVVLAMSFEDLWKIIGTKHNYKFVQIIILKGSRLCCSPALCIKKWVSTHCNLKFWPQNVAWKAHVKNTSVHPTLNQKVWEYLLYYKWWILTVIIRWPKDAPPPTTFVLSIPEKLKIGATQALRAAKNQEEAIHPNHRKWTDGYSYSLSSLEILATISILKVLPVRQLWIHKLNCTAKIQPLTISFGATRICEWSRFHSGPHCDPRTDYPKTTLCEQLGREHGKDEALACIEGKKYRTFTLEKIPATKCERGEILKSVSWGSTLFNKKA